MMDWLTLFLSLTFKVDKIKCEWKKNNIIECLIHPCLSLLKDIFCDIISFIFWFVKFSKMIKVLCSSNLKPTKKEVIASSNYPYGSYVGQTVCLTWHKCSKHVTSLLQVQCVWYCGVKDSLGMNQSLWVHPLGGKGQGGGVQGWKQEIWGLRSTFWKGRKSRGMVECVEVREFVS